MKKAEEERNGMTFSLNTTEDCNLACRYCYEINKRRKTLDIETVKKFFKVILNDPDPCDIEHRDKNGLWMYQCAIIDLIGGDALMKPKLCDAILTEWQKQVWTTDTPHARTWRKNWTCSISTNGTLFENKEVRDFCLKWKDNLNLGISIDGCPDLQNYNRPYVSGRGSMDMILKWRPWVKEHFPRTYDRTKATMDKHTIPYLFESLKFMYSIGITNIYQNFIMEENFCTDDDLREYARQIQMGIDWILETPRLDENIYWSILRKSRCSSDKNYFEKNKEELDKELDKGWCGSGSMPALAIDGNIYPCFRWLPHTTDREGAMCCGNINDGLIHKESFEEVNKATRRIISPKECLECIYEPNCPYCIGGCYAEYGELKRTTYICKITKIECEMAKRYWNRYNEKHGIKERYEEYELPV